MSSRLTIEDDSLDDLLYKTDNITKSHGRNDNVVNAIRPINLSIPFGDFVAITGPSGSGKSTLLNLLGLLDRPTAGAIYFCNQNVSNLHQNALATIRNQQIGFVFQSFQLLPRNSARENVELPLIYSGIHATERRTLAEETLNNMGLGHRLDHRPSELSGGEQQRVAIARAIVNNPDVILADEPTGSLDSRTGEEIIKVFAKLHEQGKTVIIVTHNAKVASVARRRLQLRDGTLLAIESGEPSIDNERGL